MRAQEGSAEVALHVRPPLVRLAFPRRADGLRTTGVVDEQVHGAEVADDLGHHACNVHLPSHVRCNRQSGHTVLSYAFGRVLDLGLGAPDDCHRHAGPGEGLNDSEPHPAATTGHDRDLTSERSRRRVRGVVHARSEEAER